jgi:hypothetical protein
MEPTLASALARLRCGRLIRRAVGLKKERKASFYENNFETYLSKILSNPVKT